MFFALTAFLLAGHLNAANPERSEATVSRDTAAFELLRRVRERQDSTAREILQYQALGKERMTFGIRTLGRERIAFRRELAARIHWNRDSGGRVEVLGARAAAPVGTRKVWVPESVRSEAVEMAFDPAEDRFLANLLGIAGETKDAQHDAAIRNPLASGSEEHYRFQLGDTTTIRLADGSRVRLIELRVIPLEKDYRLLRGTYWIDAATYGPVRGVFRIERAFDLQLDARHLDPDDREELDEIPWIARQIVFPVRADLHLLTLEYALWEGRWWLPRLMALDAAVEAGRVGSMPFRFERSYSDYRVISNLADTHYAVAAAADTLLESCPPSSSQRRGRDRDDRTEEGAGENEESESASAGEQEAAPGDSASAPRPLCRCRDGRCRLWDVVLADTAALLQGEHLPASIFGTGGLALDDAAARELTRELRALAGTPWSFSRPSVRWRFADADLLRYNRIEGPSIGAHADLDLGAMRLDGTVRLGFADLRPGVELGLSREDLNRRFRFAAYQRLDAVDPLQRPFGLGGTLSSFVLGRDEGDYYRAQGVELMIDPARSRPQYYHWRLFAERQREAVKETDWSFPHLLDRDHLFRPGYPADEADQVGAELVLDAAGGLDPGGFRWSARFGAEGSTGTFTFGRPSLALTTSFPLGGRRMAGLEIAGGTSFGEIPTQKHWLLGGAPSVRGFAPGTVAGTAFWRARAETSNALPGARIVLFSDAGWAGDRSRFELDPALVSVGIGASFADGLIRFDLARGLRGGDAWRFEAYVNGRL